MTNKRDREEALRRLRAEWVASFSDTSRSIPENRRRRIAILEKITKRRIK